MATKRETLSGEYQGIIGESPQMFAVLKQIDRVAPTDLSVLISGATGTGKELVAQAVHENSCRSGALVSVNCAAIPENLVESVLFGHERGAFTGANVQHIGEFERAHKGTLFLDEIAEMPFSVQPKLLRATEDQQIKRVGGEALIPVDVRIVAATNRDTAVAVSENQLRLDLYERLAGVEISVPALAARRSDIKLLVVHFLGEYCEPLGMAVPQVSSEALSLLEGYAWPGNVRELKKAIEYAVVFAEGTVLLPADLPVKIREWPESDVVITEESAVREGAQSVRVPMGLTLKAVEEKYLRETLARLDEDPVETAKTLGISLRTLQRKLKAMRSQ